MRGTGKTKALVESLPDSGVIVIVHTRPMVEYITNMIRDVRGEDYLKKCKVICVAHETDTYKLRGAMKPILFDHACWEFTDWQQLEVLRMAATIADIVNRRVNDGLDRQKAV